MEEEASRTEEGPSLQKVVEIAGYHDRPDCVVAVYLWGSRLYNCHVKISLILVPPSLSPKCSLSPLTLPPPPPLKEMLSSSPSHSLSHFPQKSSLFSLSSSLPPPPNLTRILWSRRNTLIMITLLLWMMVLPFLK